MKVSVIVPVYNAEQYIIPCLESLFKQTMDDIEILLVNDHGQDDSIDIARNYIKNNNTDKTTIIIDGQSNLGPGGARNLGINQARGEYLIFVDCDDLPEPDYCESLYNAAHQYNADFACCDAYCGDKILSNKSIHTGYLNKKNRKITLANYITYLWTYAFRREFIIENGILFPLLRSAEDSYFVTCCILMANYSVHIDKPLYHYIIHDTSISHVKDKKRWKNRIASFRKVKDFAKQKDLYSQYRCIINWLCFKKGTILAIKDFLTNL